VALLEKFIVCTCHIPVKKTSSILRPINDNLRPKLLEFSTKLVNAGRHTGRLMYTDKL